MKNLVFFLPAILMQFVFAPQKGEIKKNTAEVEQVEGLYVFYRTSPNTDYQNLENHKIGLMRGDKPRLLFDKTGGKTVEKYLSTNDITIFHDMGKCDAIL